MTQPYIPPIMNNPELAAAIAKDRDMVVANMGDSPHSATGLGVGSDGGRTVKFSPKPKAKRKPRASPPKKRPGDETE